MENRHDQEQPQQKTATTATSSASDSETTLIEIGAFSSGKKLVGLKQKSDSTNSSYTTATTQDCILEFFLTMGFELTFLPHGHISLKVPNVKFDFDVSVDSMLLLTQASKT